MVSPPIEEYECELSRLLGVDAVVAFGYSRHALIATLRHLGVESGDEVVVSPLNCKVVPLAVMSLGLRPVYADIRTETLNLDPATVAEALGPRTRGVVFQHTYGNAAGIEEVAEVAARAGVPLIEDCAQCLPVAADGAAPGRHGVVGLFSNNLRKPLPAGSGGLAATSDPELAESLREARDALPRRGLAGRTSLRLETAVHGRLLRPSTYWAFLGLARRLRPFYGDRRLEEEIATEVDEAALCISRHQAREGLRWLARMPEVLENRRACVATYTEGIEGLSGLEVPGEVPLGPLYYFPVLVERRDELLELARKRRVELVAWPGSTSIYPVEEEEELRIYGLTPGAAPVAEHTARRLVGLPMDTYALKPQRAKVLALLREHLSG